MVGFCWFVGFGGVEKKTYIDMSLLFVVAVGVGWFGKRKPKTQKRDILMISTKRS